MTADNYSITYLNGVLTVNPIPAAGGIPPLLAGAIVALPDGANLLPAFNTARVTALAPVHHALAVNTGTMEQVGHLTLMNGGVRLPGDMESPEEEKTKSDPDTSGK